MSCVFLASAALNAQSWRQYEAEAAGQAYQNADCVVLLDSTSVSVEPTGQGSFAVCRAVRVQTPKGALANRVIKYDYDPLTAFAEFKYVTVYRADGTVENLDVSRALDYVAPARAIYWGARQIMIEVGALKPGDIVEYEIAKKGFTYALLASEGEYAGAGTGAQVSAVNGGGRSAAAEEDDSRFIPPMRGQFYDIVPFWCADPTVRKVYMVSFPMEKDVQFQFYQGECTSSMRFEDGRKVYKFAASDVMPFTREPNMVDFYDAAPKLMMSTTPSWVDKSLWFNKVNEDYGSFEAYAPAQKKVDELIKGKKTDMEKIAVLTHWVADNIRYSGITMGKGEGYTLHKLSDGTYMPLDPTWVPFTRELWSSAEQQQNYLPGIPEGSDLCLTPVSAPENHYFRIKAENTVDENGTLRGTLTVSAEGQSDRGIRSIFTTGFQSEWRNNMERQLLNVSPKARLISVDYGKNPKDYQAAPISITFRYEIPGYAVTGDGVMLFRPISMNNIYNNVRSYLRINTAVEERQYGFKDGCSRLVELDETIRIPDGYTMVTEPKSDEMQGSGADFSGSLTQDGGQIVLHNVLALKKRVYVPSDWESFRDAVNAHKAYGEYVIIKK